MLELEIGRDRDRNDGESHTDISKSLNHARQNKLVNKSIEHLEIDKKSSKSIHKSKHSH
jgi:hypothetical protein